MGGLDQQAGLPPSAASVWPPVPARAGGGTQGPTAYYPGTPQGQPYRGNPTWYTRCARRVKAPYTAATPTSAAPTPAVAAVIWGDRRHRYIAPPICCVGVYRGVGVGVGAADG